MNRQKLVLTLLLLVLAGAVSYSFLRSPKEQRVATLTNRPGVAAPAARRGAPPSRGGASDGRVRIELLDREHPRFAGYRRNLFSPIFRDELKPPPFKPPAPPPRPVLPVPPPPPPPPMAAPPPPPPEDTTAKDLARFTFLGFLHKNGAKTVFLSYNNEIFLARKGSTLASAYQVTELTDEAITIRSIAGGRELVIPLEENRALNTRRGSKRTP